MPWYTGARWEGWMQYHQQIQWFSCILIGLFSIAWAPTETWIKRSRQDKTTLGSDSSCCKGQTLRLTEPLTTPQKRAGYKKHW